MIGFSWFFVKFWPYIQFFLPGIRIWGQNMPNLRARREKWRTTNVKLKLSTFYVFKFVFFKFERRVRPPSPRTGLSAPPRELFCPSPWAWTSAALRSLNCQSAGGRSRMWVGEGGRAGRGGEKRHFRGSGMLSSRPTLPHSPFRPHYFFSPPHVLSPSPANFHWFVSRFMVRFWIRFLARVLTKVWGRGKIINTMYSTTRPKEKIIKTTKKRPTKLWNYNPLNPLKSF